MGRIILLNRRYCPGEAWTNRVLAYARGFAELGEEVILYYLITNKERTPYSIDVPGVKVVDLWKSDGFVARKFRIWSFIRNLLRFRSEVQEGDKVFMYGGYDYQLKIAMDIRKKAKVFCEVTEHPDINGNAKSKLRIIDMKKGMQQISGLCVISQSLKLYYKEYGINENRILVSNMFVDTNRFSNLSITTTQKYIAYCGAVSYDKDGADILIKAFAKFYKSHKEYKLYIIGKGLKPNVIDLLKELAKNLSVDDAVLFTGPVPSSEIPQLLYNSTMLALARPDSLQAQNGFPTKLGEYLATGKPVVVTRVGEIPLFIKHGENGYLADPTPESFSKQLSWVADNYEQAKKTGQNGKMLAENEFSYFVQSKKVLEFMNKTD